MKRHIDRCIAVRFAPVAFCIQASTPVHATKRLGAFGEGCSPTYDLAKSRTKKETKMTEDEKTEGMTTVDLLPLVADVVAAHLSNNKTASSEVALLIRAVYQALDDLRTKGISAERPEPAVPVKKSVTPDYIVCLEDGKKLKMLKRHLRTAYDMSPEQYRQRWGLPADYPMVAPKYADKRSKLAKSIGLGTQPRRKRTKR